jgi:competence protein ComEA
VIDTTSRRDRRGARARSRLDRLISQAGAGRAASPHVSPADQPWLDVSLDTHPVDAAEPDWWPESGAAPPDVGAGPPEPESLPSRDPGRTLLGAPTPTADPWWRRQLNRLVERWLPPSAADGPRWRLAAFAAAGAVLLGMAVAVGLVMAGSKNEPEVPPALPAASVSDAQAPSATSPAPGGGGSIVVSVVGRVARPGLITLTDGARVADALEATGGPAAGVRLGGLNLARRLSDGEQIYVGIAAPANAEPATGASGSGAPGAGPVDLNSASLAALDTLPGVGPVTAQRILDWRTQHGRFGSIDQLRDVEGIGPTRFAKLKDLVVAG